MAHSKIVRVVMYNFFARFQYIYIYIYKGSLKSETVKYGREYEGTGTRERLRWQGPAAYTKDRPVLSLERAPQKDKTVTIKQ
jgi:hypothetical protein